MLIHSLWIQVYWWIWSQVNVLCSFIKQKRTIFQSLKEKIYIYILAGPSGQHCRCYGVFDVSVQSVFWCSQCTGVVDIWGPSGIVARRHLCDCTKTSGVLWYRTCQNIDCAKTLTASNHWQQQNIDRAKTSTTSFYAVVFFISLRQIFWAIIC